MIKKRKRLSEKGQLMSRTGAAIVLGDVHRRGLEPGSLEKHVNEGDVVLTGLCA